MRFDVKMPHARYETKQLLANLEKENPKLFISLKAAFENIHTDTFFGSNITCNEEDIWVKFAQISK